jgi:hypothetical protein
MAKTPEELEQIHEHNRKELRKLLFDSAKWLSVQHAIHAIHALPVFGSALRAAVELHKQMRSGALPWATRSIRLRDGLPLSHMITHYPAPAGLDAVTPENLVTGMREISEGNNAVVRCWDFVDLQYFNRWFSALAEQARRAAKAKRKRAAKKRVAKKRAAEKSTKPAQATAEPAPRHAGGRPDDHKWVDAAQHVDRDVRLDRDVAEHRPLPRNKKGEPIMARAVDLMTDWFTKNDPPPPKPRSIPRWIQNNPQRCRKWWGPN